MDTPRPSPALRAALACVALVIPACGGPSDGRVPVYPAAGKVTHQGKPLAGALVIFRNDAAPGVPSPTATTGDDGSFRLHTYEPDDGAPEGQYLVAVSIAPPAHDGAGLLGGRPKAPPDVLKNRYADPKASGLKAAVKPGPNDLAPIDLP